MKISFRQGLVRFQTDISNNPVFLQKINSGQNISLIVSPTPTIITISHRTSNYLFQESVSVTGAWGPFTSSIDYWIYWDISLINAVRTFGFTTLQPIVSATAPNSPAQNQHWFDTTENVMKVRQGSIWQEVLRVFAAKYASGSVLQPYQIGTQIGDYNPCFSGFILFDDEEKPVRKFTIGRRSEFIHSESVLSHAATGALTNFTFHSALNIVQAVESIPQYSLITLFGGFDSIGLAKYTDTARIAVGLVMEDLVAGQFTNYATKGFISNELWNFSLPPNSPLFVGQFGEVTTNVPQSGYIQQIGHVVDYKTIFLNIGEPVFYI